MRTHSAPFVLAAVAATALSATLAAQKTISVSDTGAQVRTWTDAGGERAAVSRDGGSTWIPLPDPVYDLNWRSRSFDPLAGDPGVPSSLKASVNNELFYVQFVTDIVPEYAQALKELGADVTRYYPNQAYIVRIERDRIAEVADQEYVRAVMELDIGHKLETDIQIGLEHGVLPTTRYNIMMVDKHKDTALLEAAVVESGGVLESRANGGILVEATLTPSQLMAVAAENTVLWIDRWTAPEYDIGNARIQSGVNFVRDLEGIDGKGMRGHINEGVYATHPEFDAQPPYRIEPIPLMGSSGSGHGTNTAGEIYALGQPNGVKGILPFGQMIYSPSIGSQRYALVQTLQDPNDIYKATFMTQSWGGGRTTLYTTTSALLDNILFDFPRIFSTNSQSNAGARPSRPEAWAKNVAGIGGFLHRNNTDPSDDCWCNTGSIGPAQDERVGVTFAAYYDQIRTTSGTSGYTPNFGGTSGATPIVNGLGGFTIQMFTEGYFGYPGVAWPDRFDARPNLTTTRVLMAVGTRQLSFTGSNNANRFQQGWGFPNVRDLYENKDNILLLDEEDVLSQGQSRTYFVWVKPGTPEFRASMHHIEPEAVPSSNPNRINSLNLTVLDPSSTLYHGNDFAGIRQGPWSSPGGDPNDIDIHENVFLQNPASGVYQVSVEAAVVRQDGHVETPQADVDFALAVRGIGGGRDKSGMVLDMTSSGPGNFQVSAANVPASGWTAGFTVMSFDTGRHPSLGNVFGLEFDNLSNNIISRGPKPGNVFAFTSSANPAHYPNATYSFPPNVANFVSGMTIDGVVVLFDGGGNIVDVSNVARVDVQ